MNLIKEYYLNSNLTNFELKLTKNGTRIERIGHGYDGFKVNIIRV